MLIRLTTQILVNEGGGEKAYSFVRIARTVRRRRRIGYEKWVISIAISQEVG
jgi:hypothetical protein